jgi:hypothetical protein
MIGWPDAPPRAENGRLALLKCAAVARITPVRRRRLATANAACGVGSRGYGQGSGGPEEGNSAEARVGVALLGVTP